MEASTTDEDSYRKVSDKASIILITKKVCASNVMSVVSQVVGNKGLSSVLIVRVSVVKFVANSSVTMISLW